MSNKAISVYADAFKRKETEENIKPTSQFTSQVTPIVTQPREISSDLPRVELREPAREIPRELPSRDEIQEFTFRMRDELKVKVQAEVPHHWQKELDEIARQLDIKKLELYRFILGEFLGKVKREAHG